MPHFIVTQQPEALRSNGDFKGIQRVKRSLVSPSKVVLTVVESGDTRGRIKAGGIRFWGAISASGDVRTRFRDPDIG